MDMCVQFDEIVAVLLLLTGREASRSRGSFVGGALNFSIMLS